MSLTNENSINQNTSEFRKKNSGNNRAENLGSITKDFAGEAMDMIQERAGQYYDQGMKQVGTLEKGFETKIRDNPVLSLVVATGLGLIAGSFWNRR